MNGINDLITVLLDLLDKKKRLFDEIMEITMEQKKDIEENDASNIEALIKRKQKAIDSVDRIDKTFSIEFSQFKKQLNIDKLDEVDQERYPLLKILKQKVEDIIDQAQNIAKIEEYNKDKLTMRLEELKKEMKHLSVGKKSIQAYQNPAFGNGAYIDKKK